MSELIFALALVAGVILGRLSRRCERATRTADTDADAVNHPAYYTDGKIETADFIEAGRYDWWLGNAVKYISRAGKKDPAKTIEDLEKAVWYVERRHRWERMTKKKRRKRITAAAYAADKSLTDRRAAALEMLEAVRFPPPNTAENPTQRRDYVMAALGMARAELEAEIKDLKGGDADV